MSKLWEYILNIFNFIGDNSGCHQIPNRCFTIKGYTFPICARCTGVLIGHILAILLAVISINLPIYFSVIFLCIMGFDWFIQYIGLKASSNFRRVVTGVLGGYGLFSIYIYLIKALVIMIV